MRTRVALVTVATGAVSFALAFELSRRPASLPFYLRFSESPPRRVSLTGFSTPEPWGRWSQAPEPVVRFFGRFPPCLTLRLRAKAFGPNTEEPIRIRIGGVEGDLRLSSELETHALSFDGITPSGEIRFVIPRPTKPKDIGAGEDTRALGIGIAEMEIGANPRDICDPGPRSASHE